MSTRPTPVVNAATFKSVIQTATYVLGIVGANSAEHWVTTHTAVLIAAGVAVVNVGGDLLAAFHAQQRVTPNEDPRALDGTPLALLSTLSSVASVIADVPTSVADVVRAEPMDD